MSRIERKKEEEKKIKEIGFLNKLLCYALIAVLLFGGIFIVDESSRSMMMLEEPRVFEHKKLDENIHELTFCGAKLMVDKQEIKNTYAQVKAEMKTAYDEVSSQLKTMVVTLQSKLANKFQ